MSEKAIVITSGNLISIQDIEVKDGSMLDGLQEIVGGYIEITRPFRTKELLCMIINEEGLLMDLPVNLAASNLFRGTIVGDVAIVQEGFRDGEQGLIGLSDDLIQTIYYLLRVSYPYLKEAKKDGDS